MTAFTIAHISDCHLGYRSGNFRDPNTGINLREQDGYNAFHEVISQIIKEKPDVVICSGDIFHSPAPSIYSIVQCQKELNRLAEANIPFYNIAGNHDATDSVRDIPSNAVLNAPLLNLNSYTEPYIVKEIGPDIVAHFVSHHGFIAQQETMAKLKLIDGKFNILVTHGSVFDTNINAILHSENEPREIVIPEEVMNMGWDYTLMGHIHERGWVSSKDHLTDTANRKQFYGGSLLRRGFTDKECKLGRGWTLWSIENNKMTPKFYVINERLQEDIAIFCKDKTHLQIEEEVLKEFENIDFSQNPIVRITFVGITKENKMAIDWNVLLEQTKQCLTFTTKYKYAEEVKSNIDSTSFNYDLNTAYKKFWDDTKVNFSEEVQEPVNDESVRFLDKGQDKVIK